MVWRLKQQIEQTSEEIHQQDERTQMTMHCTPPHQQHRVSCAGQEGPEGVGTQRHSVVVRIIVGDASGSVGPTGARPGWCAVVVVVTVAVMGIMEIWSACICHTAVAVLSRFSHISTAMCAQQITAHVCLGIEWQYQCRARHNILVAQHWRKEKTGALCVAAEVLLRTATSTASPNMLHSNTFCGFSTSVPPRITRSTMQPDLSGMCVCMIFSAPLLLINSPVLARHDLLSDISLTSGNLLSFFLGSPHRINFPYPLCPALFFFSCSIYISDLPGFYSYIANLALLYTDLPHTRNSYSTNKLHLGDFFRLFRRPYLGVECVSPLQMTTRSNRVSMGNSNIKLNHNLHGGQAHELCSARRVSIL